MAIIIETRQPPGHAGPPSAPVRAARYLRHHHLLLVLWLLGWAVLILVLAH